MSELHLLDILAARHGCFISDLNLTPFLRRAALADLCGMEESAHPLYQWQDAVRYLTATQYLPFPPAPYAQDAGLSAQPLHPRRKFQSRGNLLLSLYNITHLHCIIHIYPME